MSDESYIKSLEKKGYTFSGDCVSFKDKSQLVEIAKKYREMGYLARVVSTKPRNNPKSFFGGGYSIYRKIRVIECCLCNKEAGQFGNNAQPISKGRCCDNCNATKVIPARLKIIGVKSR